MDDRISMIHHGNKHSIFINLTSMVHFHIKPKVVQNYFTFKGRIICHNLLVELTPTVILIKWYLFIFYLFSLVLWNTKIALPVEIPSKSDRTRIACLGPLKNEGKIWNNFHESKSFFKLLYWESFKGNHQTNSNVD